MDKVKRSIAAIGVTIALLMGGAVAANAYSYTQGPEKWQWDRSGIYCGVWAYVDYNWWEESWMGGSNRDGWKRLYWAYC